MGRDKSSMVSMDSRYRVVVIMLALVVVVVVVGGGGGLLLVDVPMERNGDINNERTVDTYIYPVCTVYV